MAANSEARVLRPAPGSGRARYTELEAFRGVAGALLIIYHAYQFSREGAGADTYLFEGTPLHTVLIGLVGTAWFFSLSGFLLFLPFARAGIEQMGQASARGFLIRRAIRIVPLYYTAILVVWTLRFFGHPDQWVDLLQHLTFTHVYDNRHIFYTIGPAWTLGVEASLWVLIALLGPLLYRLCSRLSWVQRVAVHGGVAIALFALSVSIKWWAANVAMIPRDNYVFWYGVFSRGDSFFLGMLLAVIVAATGGAAVLSRPATILIRSLGVAIFLSAVLLRAGNEAVDTFFHTFSGIAFTLVLASTVLAPAGGAWAASLRHPLLQFLGLISYSLFLWHEPLMIEFSKRGLLFSPEPEAFPRNAVLLLLTTVLVAALIHKVIEAPFLELRKIFDRRGRVRDPYAEAYAIDAADVASTPPYDGPPLPLPPQARPSE
ncbi:MAG TPA: acyltransferase [Deinococcales bacterium]|nr:acyltransferase [Deinococcales bacterium]